MGDSKAMTGINSMTGFGRCETITDEYRILVEIKSVNHRYFDLSVKMPRKFNCFEARIRNILKEYISRGKTDLYILYEDYTDASKSLKFNKAIAKEYLEYFEEMASEFGIKNDITVSNLMRCQEVLTMSDESQDEDKLWEMLEASLRRACEDFAAARSTEGENLKEDLLKKLERISGFVRDIEDFSPSVVEEYRRKLTEKINEILSDSSVDEARIVTEVSIYADKICTDEEMVRLKSHVDSMKNKLTSGGACGRELDFIAQEMNREANTTLSKANSLKISDTAIALKSEIEKVREQVQNIE